MKWLILAFILIVASSCASAKQIMKNCEALGQGYFICEHSDV